jgi:hypothetical protein
VEPNVTETAVVPLSAHEDAPATGCYLFGEYLKTLVREVRPQKGADWHPFKTYRIAMLVYGAESVAVEYRFEDAAQRAAALLEAGHPIPVTPYAGKDGRIYYRGRKV